MGPRAREWSRRHIAATALVTAWMLFPLNVHAQDVTAAGFVAANDTLATSASLAYGSSDNAAANSVRVFFAMGPYRPPADPVHWADPHGTGVGAVGLGVLAAPSVYLGAEMLAWRATYAPLSASGTLIQAGSRLRGDYVGAGPFVRAALPYERYEAWASATLLVVHGHITSTALRSGQPGDVMIESSMAGTMAVAAGLDVRLWHDGGVAVRYENVPRTLDFGAFSNGSASVGMSAGMLAVYQDFAGPRWLRSKLGRR